MQDGRFDVSVGADRRAGSGPDAARAAVLKAQRLLVIMPGYAAPRGDEPFRDATAVGNTAVRLFTALRGGAMRQHVRCYRDFYANPRSPSYMAARLRELLGDGGGPRRTLLLTPDLALDAEAPWANETRRDEHLLTRTQAALASSLPDHDAVLLVHADPLGLGLGPVESALVSAFPGRIFVLNGRRRLYRLDPWMRRRLRRRRVLAETRFIEATLARVVPLVGWLLAAVDRLSRRKAA